jgi:hypothetical protein
MDCDRRAGGLRFELEAHPRVALEELQLASFLGRVEVDRLAVEPEGERHEIGFALDRQPEAAHLAGADDAIDGLAILGQLLG